ncbi:hypothetical protein [Baaleninema simplex]|uniref:hypothetical protein n=1 Tax=Baaleninema simplex TaxID=2862350 RepID=UPI000347BF44|nr:hypothetical protein [Baaleninema simplex]
MIPRLRSDSTLSEVEASEVEASEVEASEVEGNSFPELPIYLRQESKLYFEVSPSVRYGRAGR